MLTTLNHTSRSDMQKNTPTPTKIKISLQNKRNDISTPKQTCELDNSKVKKFLNVYARDYFRPRLNEPHLASDLEHFHFMRLFRAGADLGTQFGIAVGSFLPDILNERR